MKIWRHYADGYDLSIVPVFGGDLRRLYQEMKLYCVVSDQNNPMNHPIYDFDEYLGCCILYLNEEYNETSMLADPLVSLVEEVDGICKKQNDGEYSK